MNDNNKNNRKNLNTNINVSHFCAMTPDGANCLPARNNATDTTNKKEGPKRFFSLFLQSEQHLIRN